MQHTNPSPSCAPCWDTEGTPFTEVVRKTLKKISEDSAPLGQV